MPAVEIKRAQTPTRCLVGHRVEHLGLLDWSTVPNYSVSTQFTGASWSTVPSAKRVAEHISEAVVPSVSPCTPPSTERVVEHISSPSVSPRTHLSAEMRGSNCVASVH